MRKPTWIVHNQSDWSVDVGSSCSYSHIGPKGRRPVAISIVTGFDADNFTLLRERSAVLAAAPDMLEALEKIEAVFVEGIMNCPERLAKARDKIRAAIEIAKGGEA